MDSRNRILQKLRTAQQPFTDIPQHKQRLHMVPSVANLKTHFIQEAKKLSCEITQVSSSEAAIEKILEILKGESKVLSWDLDHIPVIGLAEALEKVGCQIAPPHDGKVRVGITGVDAALASTGSLVLTSGAGKPRQASLLPSLHIAVMNADQIVADMETWMSHQRELGLNHFRQASNIVLISGPSRTADIAMELILGMHGPSTVHIVIIG